MVQISRPSARFARLLLFVLSAAAGVTAFWGCAISAPNDADQAAQAAADAANAYFKRHSQMTPEQKEAHLQEKIREGKVQMPTHLRRTPSGELVGVESQSNQPGPARAGGSSPQGIWKKSWDDMNDREKEKFETSMTNMTKKFWLGLGQDGRRLALRNQRSAVNESILLSEQSFKQIYSNAKTILGLKLNLSVDAAGRLMSELDQIADASIKETTNMKNYTQRDVCKISAARWDPLVGKVAAKKLSERYGADLATKAQESATYLLRYKKRRMDLDCALLDLDRGEMENEKG